MESIVGYWYYCGTCNWSE